MQAAQTPPPSTTPRDTIAGEIRAALGRDGRPAARLADEAGISRSSMSRKLRGLAPFYVEEILAIASSLDLDPAAFLVAIAEPVAA